MSRPRPPSSDLLTLPGKRLAIEQGLSKPRGRFRRGLIHPENEAAARLLLRAVLRAAGLLRRGERNALQLAIRNLRLAFPGLPEAFWGFRILHLSDLHLGASPPLVARIRERLQGVQADLCVLTGDYRFDVTGTSDAVYRDMRQILPAIDAEEGIVGVLGNHDDAETAPALAGLGVTVLVNEAFEIRRGGQSLWLLGVDDPHYYGCDDLEAARAAVPAGGFTVLLAHSPELAEPAAAAGVDLYLCGHTHGGQICFPWLGPLWMNAHCPRAFTRGLWRHRGMQGFTSAGVGTSVLPVRFNCPPEIALIELIPA
ncbi:MAG: metallophosphoesterase [Candidatus Methylomirabilales bacterium]